MRKLFFSIVIVLLFTSCEFLNSKGDFGEKVEIGDDLEVFYKGEATAEEAKTLGEFLEEEGLIKADGGRASVQLDKEDDAYIIRIVYNKKAYKKNPDAYLFAFSSWPQLLSKKIFKGDDIKVMIADEKFKDVDEVEPMNRVKINKKSTVYYSGKVIEKEAKKLGDYLVEMQYFDEETIKDVVLTLRNGEFVVRFVVDREKYKENKEQALQDFKVYQHKISTYAFGGQKANVVLIDPYFTDIEEVGELTSKEKAKINDLVDELQNPDLYRTDRTIDKAADTTDHLPIL